MNEEKKTSRWTRIKAKIAANQDEVVFGALVTGFVVVYAGLVAYAIKVAKAENQAELDYHMAIAEAISAGKQIIPGPNGYVYLIDRNAA